MIKDDSHRVSEAKRKSIAEFIKQQYSLKKSPRSIMRSVYKNYNVKLIA
jgi:hypothetical protein